MNKIEIKNIKKTYNERCVLDNISISIENNTTTVILGPSGCGKTTLFNIVAGFESPSAGRIFLNGKEITNMTGKVSYMTQKDLLLPYKTVLENVTLPLVLSGKDKYTAEEKAKKYFSTFLIDKMEKKYPHEISGGTRQRVAFLRTYMQNKDVILLDEPFNALDVFTKNKMYSWYLKIEKNLQKTTLIITHDIDEALLFADTIHIISGKSHKIISSLKIFNNKNLDCLFLKDFIKLKRKIINIISSI